MNQCDFVIIYATDTNYVPHMAASMLSVIETNKEEKITFVVLDNNIEKSEKRKLEELCESYGQKIEFVNVQDKIENANLKTTFNKTAFARLFIGNIVETDKALYLDCDTIVCGSLKSLFDIDLQENLIAGVQDTVSFKLRTIVGLEYEEPYVNSGVLLLNLKLWRANKIQNQFIECIDKFNGNVPHNDQGVINAVCHENALILDAKYNMQDTMLFYTAGQLKELFDMPTYYDSTQFEMDKKNPIIVHYTEAHFGRPWFSDSNHPYKEIYLKFRKKLVQYWPMPQERATTQKKLKRKIKQAMYKVLPFSCYKNILLMERKRKETI